MTTLAPFAFERVSAKVRALYHNEPDLSLSLPDVAAVTHSSVELCTSICASLVNVRVLKWTQDGMLIRADANEKTVRRRSD